MSQRPASSVGGRNTGGAQRVRSAASRQGMPRRSTGSRSNARTSTYWRLPAAATCWGDHRLCRARASPKHGRLAGFDEKGEGRGDFARAERVVRGDGCGLGHGQDSEMAGRRRGHPPGARPSPRTGLLLLLLLLRGGTAGTARWFRRNGGQPSAGAAPGTGEVPARHRSAHRGRRRVAEGVVSRFSWIDARRTAASHRDGQPCGQAKGKGRGS